MTVIIWFIFPIVCVITAAIYLYQKVKAAVLCFSTRCSPKNLRLITLVVTLLFIVPAIRFGIWFIVLLHFTAFLLITDGIVIIIKKSRKNKN